MTTPGKPVSDPQLPTPRDKNELLPPAGPPPTAVGAGTPRPRDDNPRRGVDALIGIARTGIGLIIGAAASGLEALLAEVTARRGTPSQRR